jgi:hypothetical protein
VRNRDYSISKDYEATLVSSNEFGCWGVYAPNRSRLVAVRSGTGPNEGNAAGGIEQRNLFSWLRVGVSVWPES